MLANGRWDLIRRLIKGLIITKVKSLEYIHTYYFLTPMCTNPFITHLISAIYSIIYNILILLLV